MKKISSNIINISGSSLCDDTNYSLDMHFNFKAPIIIQGTVYNKKHIAVPHASIQVIEINYIAHTRRTIGYYITNDSGKYAFKLKLHLNCCYELNAYSPLI